MIRRATTKDSTSIIELSEATGLFERDELEQLQAMLTEHTANDDSTGDTWLVDEDDLIKAVAYFAPERMTRGTWNLYLIGVHPDHQRSGRGSAVLRHIENLLRSQGERVLLVETMGIEAFDYVRRFYREMGFHEEARIRDFYDEGQDKIVYWKSLL